MDHRVALTPSSNICLRSGVCCELSFAFPNGVEDAQLRMELLRIPLLSERDQSVCGSGQIFHTFLSQWINSDKVAFLESVVVDDA